MSIVECAQILESDADDQTKLTACRKMEDLLKAIEPKPVEDTPDLAESSDDSEDSSEDDEPSPKRTCIRDIFTQTKDQYIRGDLCADHACERMQEALKVNELFLKGAKINAKIMGLHRLHLMQDQELELLKLKVQLNRALVQ